MGTTASLARQQSSIARNTLLHKQKEDQKVFLKRFTADVNLEKQKYLKEAEEAIAIAIKEGKTFCFVHVENAWKYPYQAWQNRDYSYHAGNPPNPRNGVPSITISELRRRARIPKNFLIQGRYYLEEYKGAKAFFGAWKVALELSLAPREFHALLLEAEVWISKHQQEQYKLKGSMINDAFLWISW